MRVLFYAAVKDPALFELVEFYRQDIHALRALGHDVRTVNSPRRIGSDWDLAWVWWQTSGTPAVLAARARRRPAVLVSALSDRDVTASGMPSKSALVKALARVSLATADVVLATSEDTRLGLERYRTRALRAVALGVDTDQYAPGDAPPADPPVVLTISHLTEDNVSRKRILDVVRVAAEVPEARFVIAGGHGPGAPAVQAEIARLGLGERVQLPGRVSPQEKVRLLQSASVYLQPTEYEAFGVAIAEAMACGTPVVSSAVGNVPALVGDAGVLTAADAAPAVLAGAVRAVLDRADDSGLRETARRRVVERYSAEVRRRAVESTLASVT